MLGHVTDYRSVPDPELIQACLRGEQAAWDALVERYQRLVYSIPLRYGLPVADADDIFQAVFLKLLNKLETLRDRSKLASWLITTTQREVWRLARQRKRAINLDEPEDEEYVSMPGGLGSPHGEVERWEQQQFLRQALQQISDRCQQLLRMLFYEEPKPSYDDIADRLGIAKGSVGPIRARCLQQLRKAWRKIGE